MLLNPPLIRNPYLKAKFVDILFSFTRPMYQDRDGTPIGKLDAVFTTNPMAKANLVRVLTRFFVDVEQTGMHTQFYDKFNIRYNISQILKTIWEIPAHRSQMISMARDHEFFVRFVNLLMNDTTYLLDESIGKLIEIRNIQMEMADIGWQGRTNEHRAEREQTLRSDERQATSYLALGNETLHMLQYLTSEPAIVEPFMAPEVVDRLAAMMDFNLAALVGPRCTELKVKNPDKYRFDPKRLLSELVRTYLHLVKRNEFIAAVAKDGRSYAKRHFVRAAGILTRNRLAGEGDIQELMEFVGKVEGVLESEKAEEEDLGEAPDEFLGTKSEPCRALEWADWLTIFFVSWLVFCVVCGRADPIMFHLMEDPVILPGSRTTVDRTTIRSHLLSDAHDPFNRQPLKFEDVIPGT